MDGKGNIMVHSCVRIAAFEPYFNEILYINKNPALRTP